MATSITQNVLRGFSKAMTPECFDLNRKNIQVTCRFRPLIENAADKIDYDLSSITNTVNIKSSDGSNSSYTFDKLFNEAALQVEVYTEVGKPIIESVLEGFNGTVMAYGQTSSGKTHTMIGPSISDSKSKGIIPRMITTVFEEIQNAEPYLEFAVKISYCEIYIEKIRDLIYRSKKGLKIGEDRIKGVYIKDLSEVYVTTEKEVFELLRVGNENREVGKTWISEVSSRSHAIFMVTISQSNINDLSAKTGKLYLVDLAGSERVIKSGVEGRRLEEAKNINKSLSALGNVICALTNDKASHVPYRDSKLTRVLSESLGGNSKTSLIITCSLALSNEAETISTLRFGLRAKRVRNKPIVNKELSVPELKMMLLQANESLVSKNLQIQLLQQTLQKSKEGSEGIEIIDTTGLLDYNEISLKLEAEKAKVKDLSLIVDNCKQEIKSVYNKKSSLEKENEQLNMNIGKLTAAIQSYEDRIIDLNEDCNELRVRKETQERQILCLLETNKSLDKKIEEMKLIITNLTGIQEAQIENLKDHKDSIENFKVFINLIKPSESTECLKQSIHSIHNEFLQTHKNLLNFIVATEKIFNPESSYADLIDCPNNKVFSLEKNLEQLNLMYQILSNKYNSSKADVGIYEKKLQRKAQRILQLEKLLQKANDQANEFRYKYENTLKDLPGKNLDEPESKNHAKIKKLIKGGAVNTMNILCPYSLNIASTRDG